jgi:sugar/nucleoside kinase (ribokinase family)
MELRSNAKYEMLVPTSMGVRLTPLHGQPVHASDTFIMHVTSAETNVASISSYLGLPVKVLTAFVQGSPIAQLIKSNLRSRGMDFEGPEIPQGGPWGYRHQFNIADSGWGVRGPRVYNDRAGEVGRILDAKYFDLERIFGEEGVQIVHISGLIAALSPESSQFCLDVARTAKKHGTRISFDLNYRASFWKGREEELHEVFKEIASLSDILIGNEEDYQLCLDIPGPEAGGKEISVQLLAINQDNPCLNAAGIILSILCEIRSGQKNATLCLDTMESPHKFLHHRTPNRSLPTLGLDINGIQPQPVLLDYAINAAVSGTAQHLARFLTGPSVAHLQQQIHY